MEEKLQALVEELEKLNQEIMDPDIASDHKAYTKIMKRRSELEPIVELFKIFKESKQNIEEAKELLKTEKDEETLEFYKAEIEESENLLADTEEKLKVELLPRDPNDSKNAIIEIRAGAGGDEASLFAGELARMYMRYAEKIGFSTSVMHTNHGTAGGVKEIIFEMNGDKAYGTFKFESGVHRVQRIPKTESQGRIHTSAASVVVLPEAEDVDFELIPSELKIDVYRSSGPGGQSVNTTDSAVRITHIPSGITASCQDGKSQLKNKEKALKVLKSRLFEISEEKRMKELGETRLASIGAGDRSDKIRTYNFPQDRVTDHRIKKSWNNLPSIMDGEIDDIVETMRVEEQARIMAQN